MKELGNKVTIMAEGIITGKSLTFDQRVKYEITTDNGTLCYVFGGNIVGEEIKEPNHVTN